MSNVSFWDSFNPYGNPPEVSTQEFVELYQKVNILYSQVKKLEDDIDDIRTKLERTKVR
jgi:predicted  nucleic acid-binding Zn-ribbon protein